MEKYQKVGLVTFVLAVIIVIVVVVVFISRGGKEGKKGGGTSAGISSPCQIAGSDRCSVWQNIRVEDSGEFLGLDEQGMPVVWGDTMRDADEGKWRLNRQSDGFTLVSKKGNKTLVFRGGVAQMVLNPGTGDVSVFSVFRDSLSGYQLRVKDGSNNRFLSIGVQSGTGSLVLGSDPDEIVFVSTQEPVSRKI